MDAQEVDGGSDRPAPPLPRFGEGKQQYLPFLASVVANRLLTTPPPQQPPAPEPPAIEGGPSGAGKSTPPVDGYREIRHLSFGLGESGLRYQPGDVLMVHPVNPAPAVDAFVARLGVPPTALISLTRATDAALLPDPECDIPSPLTWRELFSR